MNTTEFIALKTEGLFKHSPLYSPNQDEYREILIGGKIQIRVLNENFDSSISKEEAEANAAYIVHACNHYPQMLEMLQKAQGELERVDGRSRIVEEIEQLLNQLEV